MRGTSAFKYITRRGRRTKPGGSPRRLALYPYLLYLGNYSVRKEKFGYSPGKRLTRQGIALSRRRRRDPLANLVRGRTHARFDFRRADLASARLTPGNVASGNRGDDREANAQNFCCATTCFTSRVIPRDSCRRAWVTALTGPCFVYDQVNRSEYLFAFAEYGTASVSGNDSPRIPRCEFSAPLIFHRRSSHSNDESRN